MENNSQPTDEALMLRLQKGDVAAFEALYDRYHSRLFHFLLRFVGERALAEDLLQETFLRVFRQRKRYGRRSRFSTYLFTIGRNLCLDTLKAWEKRHLLANQKEQMERTADPTRGPFEELEAAELGEILRREIQTLPRDQREVVVLSKYSGLSYQEIAQIVGSTPAAVKQKACRALLALREKLTEYTA